MEITGIPGWVVRNSYDKDNVMTKDFRERAIDNIQREVSALGQSSTLAHPKFGNQERAWVRLSSESLAQIKGCRMRQKSSLIRWR